MQYNDSLKLSHGNDEMFGCRKNTNVIEEVDTSKVSEKVKHFYKSQYRYTIMYMYAHSIL
jgi:hypothetical protein